MKRFAVLALLALVVAGSAGAAPSGKPKVHRVVKHHGAITAILTYTLPPHAPNLVTLVVKRHGRLVLRHRVPDQGPATPSLSFRYVAGNRVPAAVVDSYLSTAIVIVSPRPAWIVHDWGRYNYRGERVGGRYYFDASDNRFLCTYTSCADAWVPAQIWAIKHERLVDVTRAVPALVAADARKAWRWYLRIRHGRGRARGIGALAGWCADEYTLARGSHCDRVLRQKLEAGELKAPGALSGRRFIRTLHRDLARWGYARR